MPKQRKAKVGQAKRSLSEETEIRKLLLNLTDLVLEVKEDQRKNNTVIAARLDELESGGRGVGRQLGALGKKLDNVAMLASEATRKTNDLHKKLIGSADTLGRRLHELERKTSTGSFSRR